MLTMGWGLVGLFLGSTKGALLLTFMSGQKVLRKLPYERSIGAKKTVGE